ncbi:MAG: transcriptional regulator, partial [Pseudomonadota bacterium]
MIHKEQSLNILFTSVGRRVALVQHFKKTLLDLGLKGTIVGVDFSDDAPAFHVVDKAYKICRIDDPLYIRTLVEICRREKIQLLFPLIDTDLMLLAESRQDFAAVGTTAVISDPPVIEISLDKNKTHAFFVTHGIDTPKVFDAEAVLAAPVGYPLFMKPLDGNASKGSVKIRDERELRFFKDYV